MIRLYWEIGKTIVDKQAKYQWGSSVIDNFSQDLRRELGILRGFSSRNLRDMKVFAREYPDLFTRDTIWRQLVAKLPWGHNIKLISGIKDKEQRLWYAKRITSN